MNEDEYLAWFLKGAQARAIKQANPKLKQCPVCKGTEDEGHKRCFHCIGCGYLQCCECEYDMKKATR